MPWTVKDVEEKIKGLSAKQKEIWVKVANSALSRCLEGGGSEDTCEASAIRQANATAKKVSEADRASPLELVGDIIPLVEGTLGKNGRTPIKLIAPGWGASGYYPAEVLERDGPVIFKAGTQMFWDHPKKSDENDRPERSLRDLAAVLVSDAAWMPEHPHGPGLYGEAAVYKPYRERLAELAPDIGVSIMAWGAAIQGEREGKKGMVIQEIKSGRSVDFVTAAGAGGQVLELFEAARVHPHGPHTCVCPDCGEVFEAEADQKCNNVECPECGARMRAEVVGEKRKEKEAAEVDLKEAQELKDQNAALKVELLKAQTDAETAVTKAQESIAALQQDVARHSEADQLRAAQAIVAEVLEANREKLPEVTIARLKESLALNFPVDEKKVLKEAEYRVSLGEKVKAELDYVAKIAKAGEIRGMGSAGGSGSQETAGLAESFEAAFIGQGETPEEAKRLAAYAAVGR